MAMMREKKICSEKRNFVFHVYLKLVYAFYFLRTNFVLLKHFRLPAP